MVKLVFLVGGLNERYTVEKKYFPWGIMGEEDSSQKYFCGTLVPGIVLPWD